jgi:general secretion pathway protein L
MAETIIARTCQPDGQWQWSALAAPTAVQQGRLEDLSAAAVGAKVTLLLPATDALLMEVNLPVKSSRKLQKALPYAVEELLADEVEAYHLAWSKQADGPIAVAAIAHEKMGEWLQCCNKAGITLEAAYPETVLLPWLDDSITVVLDGNQALVRYKNGQGGGVERDYLPLFIDKLIAEHDLPAQIQLYSVEPAGDLAWSDTVAVNTTPIASVLALLQANLPKPPRLNLLTEPYRPQQESRRWQAWLPTAALLISAGAVQYGIVLNQYWQSEAQLAALESANLQTFKQAFPSIKRVVNIKTQAEQELIALRKNSHGGSAFLRLLYGGGEVLQQDPALQLQHLDFMNDILSLQLTGTDIAQLDGFSQQLQAKPELAVKIQSAETNAQGLSARLDLSEKKP